MDLNQLSAILETVPEAHLDIFGIMWKMLGEDGKFDETKATENPDEVNRALQQANYHVQTVRSLVRVLEELCREPKL